MGRVKSLSPYGHTLLQEIVDRKGLSEEDAFGKRQVTLGSLYYNGYIDMTDDPDKRFVANEAGKAELALYRDAEIERLDTKSGWSARLPQRGTERTPWTSRLRIVSRRRAS